MPKNLFFGLFSFGNLRFGLSGSHRNNNAPIFPAPSSTTHRILFAVGKDRIFKELSRGPVFDTSTQSETLLLLSSVHSKLFLISQEQSQANKPKEEKKLSLCKTIGKKTGNPLSTPKLASAIHSSIFLPRRRA
jgi:hypothetical protein